MDKLNLALRAISIATTLITGSSAFYQSNMNASTTVIADSESSTWGNGHGAEPIISVPTNGTQTENKDNSSTTETTPPTSDTPSQPAYGDGATGHSDCIANCAPEPAKPVKDPGAKSYNSTAEWEADVWGLCPSQRPAYTNIGRVSYIPAIEISGVGWITSPTRAVEIFWDNAMRDGVSQISLGSYGMITNNRTYGNDRWTFRMDLNTKIVSYGMTFPEENLTLTADKKAEFDNLANQLSAHLKWVDNTYHAKCPNN